MGTFPTQSKSCVFKGPSSHGERRGNSCKLYRYQFVLVFILPNVKRVLKIKADCWKMQEQTGIDMKLHLKMFLLSYHKNADLKKFSYPFSSHYIT